MTRLFPALACLFLLIAAPRAMAEPEDIAAASRSVVRVVLISQTSDGMSLVGHGSGIAVGRDLVVTNAHVVSPLAEDENLRVGIVPSQGKGGWFAKVVRFSPGNDLALLRLSETGTLIPVTFFTGSIGDGQDVYAVGYPGNVDLAQGLEMADLMRPTTPVKTRGSVSAGRSTKGYETILHTAPIGTGNSGGPLLDACGRVVGANSFGTVSDGSDSEFFFAVSTREIVRFLRQAGVTTRTSGEPCRSLAELGAAERERLLDAKTAREEQDLMAATRRSQTAAKAARRAELEVFAERESGMALTGAALLLAIVAGGSAFWLGQQEGRTRHRNLAAGIAGLLVVGALLAWFSRPGLEEIDERIDSAAAEPSEAATLASNGAQGGEMICVIEPRSSRITVSQTIDVPLTWKDGGCVNQRTQYGLSDDGWSRVLVSADEGAVAVNSFDPGTRTFRTDRYLLGNETMGKVGEARSAATAPACGVDESVARDFGTRQQAIKDLLPATPNERLVYRCETKR